MELFRYDSAVLERFPAICGGALLARELQNRPAPHALTPAFEHEQQAALERLKGLPLSGLPSISAWRAAFSRFGVEPTRYRSAAESLLRRLTKQGDIPGINLLVDLGNLVSIRYALPVAIFDLHAVSAPVLVRPASGQEQFTPLGEAAGEQPEPGEIIFVDQAGQVQARRWCWRQSARSAAGPETSEALITVEAQHLDGRAAIEAALADLQGLVNQHAGRVAAAGVLDRTNPIFEV